MSDFSFLAVPNIEGMRLGWYIQIFGICILFGICLFFVIYFWLIYHKKQQFVHQSDSLDQQAQELHKTMIVQHIQHAVGKKKLTLFIEYLERFVTTDATGARPMQTYATLKELLSSQGFTHQEVDACEQTLYTDKEFPKYIETKIDEYFAIKG